MRRPASPRRSALSRAYVLVLGLSAGAGWYAGLAPLPLVAWAALEGAAAVANRLPLGRA